VRLHSLLAVLTVATPIALWSQQAPPIHVDVRLVNVFVNVTDTNGAPVAGLTQEDFSLAEDGHPQKISFFERDTGMPLSIVLAIDTSGSTHKDLGLEKSAAHNFVHAFMRPIDQLDLIDFNSDVREVVPFTNNVHRIDSGLEDLSIGPATALYDAVYLASQSLAPRRGRKVLVIISDGGNTVKGVDYAQALEQARRGEVMVYSLIDLPIVADAGRETGGEHALITLSEETGGKYYYADEGNLEQAFKKVSEDLRTQYLLGYYPTHRVSDSSFRTISVTLTKSSPASVSYTIRHRTGYYASPGQ
jgi:Ca-activated chloride channel homolog